MVVSPLFHCHKNKPSCESLEQIHLDRVKKWNKTYSFEVSIGLLLLFLIIIKNKPCSESLEQIHFDGVKKWNKTYSFEVSIQTIYIKKFPQLTVTGLITT